MIQDGIKEDVISILRNAATVLNPLVMVTDVLDLHTVCSIKNVKWFYYLISGDLL